MNIRTKYFMIDWYLDRPKGFYLFPNSPFTFTFGPLYVRIGKFNNAT